MNNACVIVSYNDSDRIIDLCKTLISYNFFKYIVITDNNSKEEELKKYAQITNNSNIVLLQTESNLGFSGANNYGFDYLKDKEIDYVFTINSDISVEKETLESLASFLKSHDNIAIASGQMIEYGKKKQCYYDFPTIRNAMSENLLITKLFRLKPKHKKRIDNYLKVDYIRSSLWACKYDILMKVKGFDTNTFLYHVETCVGIKVFREGYNFALVDNLYYNHNHIYKKGYKMKGYKDTFKSLKYIFKNYYKKNSIQMFFYKTSYYIGFVIRKICGIK